MDVAERTLEVGQDIATRRGSYPVVATKRGRAWAMDYKDFTGLEKDSYRLTLGAENALLLTPSDRKKMISDMAAQGSLPPEKMLQLVMGNPDLEAATAQVTAFEDNADWLCEELMEGKMPALSELQKPDLVYQRVRAAGLTAHEFGAPDKIVMNFELFAAQVNEKIKALMPPPPPEGMPVNGSPPAPTAPAPAL